jgi:hypothetical protein
MPATISANRLQAGGPAVAVLFIVNSNMRALIDQPLWQKKFDQSATGCTRNAVDKCAFASCGRASRLRNLATNTP